MNMESQLKCMRFRSMSLAQWWVLLALLSATGSPRSLLLTRNIGTTPGVHAGRAQTLQCIYPQCR